MKFETQKTPMYGKKVEVDQDVYSLALERINHAFDLYEHIAVSFSGGKDSTICLQLALKIATERKRLPLRVIFFDEEALAYQTEDYVRRMSQREDIDLEWYCIPIKHRNACSRKQPYWYPWAQEDKKKWVRPLPPEAITKIKGYDDSKVEERLSIPELVGALFPPEKYGISGMIMGIRAQESMTRYQAVARREKENYIIQHCSGYGGATRVIKYGNLWKIYPIYDWQTDDVWTAPNKFGWDYSRAYDVMEKAGISHSIQRLAPPYGEEPMHILWMWKICFPEIWDKMSERVEGAITGGRYCVTQLYGYGGKTTFRETPEETIQYYIKKWPKEKQSPIAERVKKEIRVHFNKTSDPIALRVKHPLTGVSWEYLLKLAKRGDFKHRKMAVAGVSAYTDQEGFDRQYKKYKEAIRAADRQGKVDQER